MTAFSDLGLADPLLQALDRAGYDQPTPIQYQSIPHVISKNDIFGIAQTGTGKTAAFALPLLHRLITDRHAPPRKGARVLILSPTRELASQIAESFRVYASCAQISVAAVFGGVRHGPQAKKLKNGIDILVATPGRLLDHVSSGTIQLGETEVLVLDEADQMLDLGFVKSIRSIVAMLPEERQTLLFSATMPPSISQLARDFLRHPKKISVTPASSTVDRINQRVIHIDAVKKRALIVSLIKNQDMSRVIVFTRTKRGADRVAKYIDGSGIRAMAIHGNKSQKQRERALEAFKVAKVQVLVATDIAARGINVDDISHVINYELPEVPEAYVHRIGRTARAGAAGSAISLCDRSEIKYLHNIERLIGKKVAIDPDGQRLKLHHSDANASLTTDAAGTDSADRTLAPHREAGAGGGARAKAQMPNQRNAKPKTRRKSRNKPGDASSSKASAQSPRPKRTYHKRKSTARRSGKAAAAAAG